MKALHVLLLMAGSGALVGVLVPELPGEDAARPAGVARQSAWGRDKVQVVQQDQWLAGEMALPRQQDGHYYADITIAGQPARMLVDTGASVVALTGEDAEAIGLTWEPGDVRQVATGASGAVYGVSVTLDRVALGEMEVRNVAAIIVPEGLGISLLGQSFLSQIGRVEIRDGAMVLGG
ncbi:MAG: TIGR02281 family clan AA aspartic protease [Croceibacterium sp.]